MVNSETAKGLLALHGEVRPQPASNWTGAFPIPQSVESFYQDVGPFNVTIKAHGNPFFLPSLADLWQFQAGYRWGGLSENPIEDWPNDWLVVADQGGDPFIFVRLSDVVLHAYHGDGEWNAVDIFPDLNAMATCLAQLGAITSEAGNEFLLPDYSIRPKYRALASTRLQDLLGEKSDANVILRVLGWG